MVGEGQTLRKIATVIMHAWLVSYLWQGPIPFNKGTNHSLLLKNIIFSPFIHSFFFSLFLSSFLPFFLSSYHYMCKTLMCLHVFEILSCTDVCKISVTFSEQGNQIWGTFHHKFQCESRHSMHLNVRNDYKLQELKMLICLHFKSMT